MDVANVKNDSVVTLVPIRDILKDKPPGAYVLIAMDAAKDAEQDYYEDGTIAAQWVIDSDIALTTLPGRKRSHRVRALLCQRRSPRRRQADAWSRKDNNVLATVTTDGDGRADFAAGSAARDGRRRAGRRHGLWLRRRFQLPRPAPCRVRPDRSRRRRTRDTGSGRRLPLHRARRLSAGRDRASRRRCCATASAPRSPRR